MRDLRAMLSAGFLTGLLGCVSYSRDEGPGRYQGGGVYTNDHGFYYRQYDDD
jgi:hypothetical protein